MRKPKRREGETNGSLGLEDRGHDLILRSRTGWERLF
jgi:hypothetical protein